MITLAISPEAKVSKAPHWSDFQAEKVHHLLTSGTRLLPAWSALERLNPPRNPEELHVYPECRLPS